MHMLTAFNLVQGATLAEFRDALDRLTEHMVSLDMLEETGPLGRRVRDTIMDTDEDRKQEYFFIMTFRNRAQCDRAVDYILPRKEPGDSVHRGVEALVRDPVFLCWQDLDSR